MSRGLELRLFCLRFGVQDFGTHPSSPAQLLCFEDLSSDEALSSSAVSNEFHFHFRLRVSMIPVFKPLKQMKSKMKAIALERRLY